MLLQFSVENFLSFREAGVLSMLAADGVEHPPHMVMDGPGGKKVLRCAAVYGANASGKSNLVKALALGTSLALNGRRPNQPTLESHFKLDPTCKGRPSKFEWELGIQGKQYSYGFEITPDTVLSEWLFRADGKAEYPLFQREKSSIVLGPKLTSSKKRRTFLQFVAEGTRPNQLFLAEARERNGRELAPLYDLLASFQAVAPTTPAASLFDFLEKAEGFRGFVVKLLDAAGVTVADVKIEEHEDAEAQMRATLFSPQVAPQDIALLIMQKLGSGLYDLHTTKETKKHRSLVTYRRGGLGDLVPFDIFEESDGTQRLLQLAPMLYRAEAKLGNSLIAIDELERSLHPLLTRAFLDRFLAAGGTSQLLFTTHDTNLLDLNLLSRDAIWFTEKDQAGATVLYSLAEFKADQIAALGPQLEKGYLQGRFGAIPFLADAVRLGWKKEGTG